MKLSNLFPLAVIAVLLYSCSQSGGSSEKKADSTFTTECYKATDRQDTATLTLETHADKKITGHLVFDFDKKDKNDGSIKGEFKGDTLYVDYEFKVGENAYHKNPLAFLKKDGKLILGVGKMETRFGKTYFRKDLPINFDGGRFIFETAECKVKE